MGDRLELLKICWYSKNHLANPLARIAVTYIAASLGSVAV